MKLGFTGTREGMKNAQARAVADLLRELEPSEGHHGDCIGADSEFHSLAHWFMPITIHPGPDEEMRANCQGTTMRAPKTHFARNRDIVNETDALLATPRLMTPEDRGGTWYTINYARKVGKPVWIVWPDGSVTRARRPRLPAPTNRGRMRR